MKQKANSVTKESLHKWDHKIKLIKKQMQTDLSARDVEIIEKYDVAMVNGSIQKPTRYLHLNRLLSLSRRLQKNWDEITKDDIEKAIYDIMETYSDNGRDTEYTYDHKKVLNNQDQINYLSPVPVDGFAELPVFGTSIALLPVVVLFAVDFCGSGVLGFVLPVGGDFVVSLIWEGVLSVILYPVLPV